MAKPVGVAVNVLSATVKIEVIDGDRGTVEVPICKPEIPKEITVPDSVIADPPTESDWLPIANPVGAAVKV